MTVTAESLMFRFADPLPAPAPPVPDLTGLSVLVVPPAPVTEAEVAERFAVIMRAAAKLERRPNGALVEPNDEVVIDALTYVHGQLVPYGALSNHTISANDDGTIGELGLRLVGLRVGSSAQITALIPLDYPDARLAGLPAVFLVDVKQASAVTMPSMEPESLAAVGFGDTLDAMMENIVKQLRLEREEEYQAEVKMAVLDELIERTPFTVSAEHIDHELGRRWLEREGRFLLRKQLKPKEVEAVFEACRTDESHRRTIERELKGALIIRALLDSKKLVLGPEDLVSDGLKYAYLAGAHTEAEATALFNRDTPEKSRVINALVLNAALKKLAAMTEVLPARPTFTFELGAAVK